METESIVLLCCAAFVFGWIFSLLMEKKLLRFKFDSGYRQAAQDILRDSICKDKAGHWHQLQMTWKDHKQPRGTFY